MNVLLAFGLLLGVTATYGVEPPSADRRRGPGVHRPGRRDRHHLHRARRRRPRRRWGCSRGTASSRSTAGPVDSWADVSTLIRANLDRPAQLDRGAGRPAGRAAAAWTPSWQGVA